MSTFITLLVSLLSQSVLSQEVHFQPNKNNGVQTIPIIEVKPAQRQDPFTHQMIGDDASQILQAAFAHAGVDLGGQIQSASGPATRKPSIFSPSRLRNAIRLPSLSSFSRRKVTPVPSMFAIPIMGNHHHHPQHQHHVFNHQIINPTNNNQFHHKQNNQIKYNQDNQPSASSIVHQTIIHPASGHHQMMSPPPTFILHHPGSGYQLPYNPIKDQYHVQSSAPMNERKSGAIILPVSASQGIPVVTQVIMSPTPPSVMTSVTHMSTDHNHHHHNFQSSPILSVTKARPNEGSNYHNSQDNNQWTPTSANAGNTSPHYVNGFKPINHQRRYQDNRNAAINQLDSAPSSISSVNLTNNHHGHHQTSTTIGTTESIAPFSTNHFTTSDAVTPPVIPISAALTSSISSANPPSSSLSSSATSTTPGFSSSEDNLDMNSISNSKKPSGNSFYDAFNKYHSELSAALNGWKYNSSSKSQSGSGDSLDKLDPVYDPNESSSSTQSSNDLLKFINPIKISSSSSSIYSNSKHLHQSINPNVLLEQINKNAGRSRLDCKNKDLGWCDFYTESYPTWVPFFFLIQHLLITCRIIALRIFDTLFDTINSFWGKKIPHMKVDWNPLLSSSDLFHLRIMILTND